MMRLCLAFMSVVAVLLIACEPPRRSYPMGGTEESRAVFYATEPGAPADEDLDDAPPMSPPSTVMLMPAMPIPPIGEMPDYLPAGGYNGAAECASTPLFSFGNGCEPIVGGDDISSIQLRVASGETILATIGKRPNFYLEDPGPGSLPIATFAGTVNAASYSEAIAPVVAHDFLFAEWTPTVLIDASAGPVWGYLPWSGVQPGKRYTAVLINGDKAVIAPLTGELVDGSATYVLGGKSAFVTVIVGDMDGDKIGDAWFVVGRSP